MQTNDNSYRKYFTRPLNILGAVALMLTSHSAAAALFQCAGRDGQPGSIRNSPAPGCFQLTAMPESVRIKPMLLAPDFSMPQAGLEARPVTFDFSRPLPPSATLRGKLDPSLQVLLAREAAVAAVPDELVYLLIEQESRFNSLAVSRRGALGLMQLMPGTARNLGVANPWDAAQNLRGGIRYLGQLIRRFAGSLPLAVAAYNAGPGAVDSAGRRIPRFRETRNYVQRIMHAYDGGSQLQEAMALMPGDGNRTGSSGGAPVQQGGGVQVVGRSSSTVVKGFSINPAPGGGNGGKVLYRWLDEKGQEHTTNYKPARGRILSTIKP